MKKLRIAIGALIFLGALTGASPWEGPAAAAVGGELPDGGYYAATNSFPRNTVVDVLNLETGKSVRVIVAAGLDSPGFLAILSRKAAGEVGLQGRSVARIRMSQPGDPIALSRFIDGAGPSRDPASNPRAVPNGSALTSPVPSDAALPQERPDPAPRGPDVDILPASPAPIPRASRGIVSEVPERPLPNPVQAPPALPPSGEGYDWSLLPAENRPPADPAYQGYFPPDTELILPNGPSPVGTPAAAPPLDSALFIAPLEQGPPPAQRFPEGAHTDIMAPIETVPAIPAAPPVYSGGDRLPPEMAAAEIAPIERISPISPAAPPQQGTPLPSPEKGAAGGAAFSVPLISSLERDQYYLQLRAFSQAETVNQELTKIGKAYPLVILSGKESGKTIYRILLGPINQGESNALLQRFKNMGYTDAFLRQGS